VIGSEYHNPYYFLTRGTTVRYNWMLTLQNMSIKNLPQNNPVGNIEKSSVPKQRKYVVLIAVAVRVLAMGCISSSAFKSFSFTIVFKQYHSSLT